MGQYFIVDADTMDVSSEQDSLGSAVEQARSLKPGKYQILKVLRNFVVEDVPARRRVQMSSVDKRAKGTGQAAS